MLTNMGWSAINNVRRVRDGACGPGVGLAALAVLLLASANAGAVRAQQTAPHAAKPPSASTGNARRADIARFSARVDAALADSKAQKSFWGILVVDRQTGEILYEANADKYFTPASNAKIVTSSFAFATLGPDFRFRTTLETTGALSADGSLKGDLVLVGRGDPDLSNRVFPYAGKAEHDGPVDKVLLEMVDAAIAKGLKSIDGDIVADDSYYPYDPYPPGWNVGDLFFTYGAPVSAISFNDNTFEIEITPGLQAGDAATLNVEPLAAAGTFTQKIVTGPAGSQPNFSVTRQPGVNFIFLRGTIPAGHAPVKLDLAMMQPAETAALALKQAFESRGVHVTGTAIAHHALPPEIYPDSNVVLGPAPEPTPENATVLAEHLSPTLLETARMTNKVSQNLHAELLLRAAARATKGYGVTDAGIWAEQDFLKNIDVAENDVLLEDGSGLSGGDLLTPRSLVQILRFDSQQPWGEGYISTFPIAGVDGTLETRMKKTSAAGMVFAKTGSLERVRALSGFATTTGGEHLVFSIFGNNNAQAGHDAQSVIDSIVVAMVDTLGTAPPAAAKKTKKK